MENATTKTETVTGNAKSVAPEKIGTIKGNDGKEVDIYRHTINRGQGIGNTYLAPDIEKLTYQELVNLHGEDNVLSTIRSAFRKEYNQIYKGTLEEAEDQGKDKDPNAIMDLWKSFFKELSATGLSKAELEERQSEFLAELIKHTKLVAHQPHLMPKIIDISSKLEKICLQLERRASKGKKAEASSAAPAA